jgi:predicted signal transduction protein with EAL and GGDEF domain
VRSNDALARLGGDEFGLLLARLLDGRRGGIANALLRAVEQYQFVWGASTFTVGASIGVVPLSRQLPTDHASAAGLPMRRATPARIEGRNRVHVYQEDDTVVAQRHGEMQWVARVKRALNENRFFLERNRSCDPGSGTQPLRALVRVALRMRELDGSIVPPAHSCRQSSATT